MLRPPMLVPGGGEHSASGPRDRARSRELDISESHYLLLEMVTQEPVLQYCFRILQGTCLAQGIMLKKKGIHDQDPQTRQWSSDATQEFQEHLDTHYLPFCQEALRMFYICGFVPWRLRKLHNSGKGGGVLVPEVLPLGTFTWTTELLSQRTKRRKKQQPSSLSDYHLTPEQHARLLPVQGSVKKEEKKVYGHAQGRRSVQKNHEGKYVMYRVVVNDGGLDEDDIFVYDFVPARYDVCTYSVLYSTIASPLSHLIVDYKNLRQAQIRRSHADAWNTQVRPPPSSKQCARVHSTDQCCRAPGELLPTVQAKIITTSRPNIAATSNNMPDFHNEHFGNVEYDSRYPHEHSFGPAMCFDSSAYHEQVFRDHVLGNHIHTKQTPHNPLVYTLLRNSESLAVQELKPVEDVAMLLEKYTRDVALVMGIPPHFVVSRTNLSSSSAAGSQLENLHTFTSSCQVLCKHLELLLSDVHEAIYGSPASFNIVAQPRVAIESIQDIKDLVTMGLMLPHKGAEVVDMLMQSQNLPTGGDEGYAHARNVHKKMFLESSSSAGAKKKK